MRSRFRALIGLAAGAALLLLGGCTAAKPDYVAALKERAEEQGVVRVIMRLKPEREGAVRPASADEQNAAIAALDEKGIEAAAVAPGLPYLVAELTPAQVDAAYDTGLYDSMMEDQLAFRTLAQSAPLVEAPQVFARGGRGQGQSVAILDTGVDRNHPFLAGRVTAEACFSTNSAATGAQSTCPNQQSTQIGEGAARPCNATGCEHGTHVAGIAAGRGDAFTGIAPDAEIVAIQVFSRFVDRQGGPTPCRDSGQASPCIASFTSDQIRGLSHVLTLSRERSIASANMSLGGGRSTGACDTDLTKDIIDQLRAEGIATVIAAGNDGFADAVSRPGCISTAVTVGATTKQNQLAPFSNRGPLVDMLAPGVQINSSVPNGGFMQLSGTSMAAPHVAGAFAALRSARPSVGVAGIETALRDTGVAVGDRRRIAMLAALNVLPQGVGGAAVTATTAQTDGEIESLPPDRVVRMIVRLRTSTGVGGVSRDQAVASARNAATAAGVSSIEEVTGQPVLIIEATRDQYALIAGTGAVESMQVEGVARTQN